MLMTNAINDFNCILSRGLCDGATIQESETYLEVSGGKTGNDNERNRGNGFWKAGRIQDKGIHLNKPKPKIFGGTGAGTKGASQTKMAH
jgi:hypothetical protein